MGFCLLAFKNYYHNSISLQVISLLKLSVSSWFSLGRLYVLNICLFPLGYPICWHKIFFNIFLQFFISMVLVVINVSHLSIISLFQFFLFISKKDGFKQFLISLVFNFFITNLFIFSLIVFISFLPLSLSSVWSSFTNS